MKRAGRSPEQFHIKQVELLYNTSASMLILTVLVFCLSAMLWEPVSSTSIIFWVMVNIMASGVRYYFIQKFKTDTGAKPSDYWKVRFTASLFAAGTAWGLSGIILFPADSYCHQVMLAFITAVMAMSAVIFFSCHLPSLLAFVLPVTLPTSMMLGFSNFPYASAMGFLLLFLLGIIILTAKKRNKAIKDAFLGNLEGGISAKRADNH